MNEKVTDDTSPGIPRRMVLAGLAASAFAGGSVFLATLGQVTSPQTQSFRFARGAVLASDQQDQLRSFLLPAVRDARFHVVAIGHTGTTGDTDANQNLSVLRAEVARDIAIDLGIDPDRIAVSGLGGAAPFAQPDDLNDRAWQAQLARVEVTLQVRR